MRRARRFMRLISLDTRSSSHLQGSRRWPRKQRSSRRNSTRARAPPSPALGEAVSPVVVTRVLGPSPRSCLRSTCAPSA